MSNTACQTFHNCTCTICQQHPYSHVAQQHRAINRVLASLNERNRRRFVGLLAIQWGRGSILRLAQITGLSRNTIYFAIAAIRRWWVEVGRVQYSGHTQLLIHADSGGANSADSWLWKAGLQALADEFQLTITVTHFPTGASKWNPIEHRMFSPISQNWAGQPLVSYETMLKFIRTTRTDTGFHCRARLITTVYETRRKITSEEKAQINLRLLDVFPEWNYTIPPHDSVGEK